MDESTQSIGGRALAIMVVVVAVTAAPHARATTYPTWAAFNVEESLENRVRGAAKIVRGTIRPGMVRSVKVNDVTCLEVTLDVAEAYKGARPEQLTFTARPDSRLDAASRASWADVLVFLDEMPALTRANT